MKDHSPTSYTFTEYHNAASITAKSHDSAKDALSNFALGLAGETGEVVDEIKKHLYHDKPLGVLALDSLIEEMGDVLWYLTAIAEELGVSLEEIAKVNIRKLRYRHGDEGFKPHAEQNRDEDQS